MSRSFEKLFLKYKYLELELEESEEKLDEYSLRWGNTFGKYFSKNETEVWINEETGEVSYSPPNEENIKTPSPKPDKLKKLYKTLSKHCHPDKGGTEEKFNKIKNYYNNNNFFGLYSIAKELNIDVPVDELETEILEASCRKLQDKINYNKKTLAWIYCTGSKKDKLTVVKALEIQFGIKIPKEELPSEIFD